MSTSGKLLQDKVAIVTGARRGIGQAIALAFAEAGANLAIADWEVADGGLQDTAEQIQKMGRRALAVQTDISKKTEVDNLVRKTLDEFGTIDILVNNAAIGDGTSLLEATEEMWQQVIDINLKGAFLCCQAVAKGMIERKSGNIISIASVEAFSRNPYPKQSNTYGIAKAGIVMLTKGLAWELGAHNVRINAIAPGGVKTEMTRPLWENPEFMAFLTPQLPMGRIAQPEEIASVAVFLASDASSYITGETVIADGGLLT